jgi:hypothetical protein
MRPPARQAERHPAPGAPPERLRERIAARRADDRLREITRAVSVFGDGDAIHGAASNA